MYKYYTTTDAYHSVACKILFPALKIEFGKMSLQRQSKNRQIKTFYARI